MTRRVRRRQSSRGGGGGGGADGQSEGTGRARLALALDMNEEIGLITLERLVFELPGRVGRVPLDWSRASLMDSAGGAG